MFSSQGSEEEKQLDFSYWHKQSSEGEKIKKELSRYSLNLGLPFQYQTKAHEVKEYSISEYIPEAHVLSQTQYYYWKELAEKQAQCRPSESLEVMLTMEEPSTPSEKEEVEAKESQDSEIPLKRKPRKKKPYTPNSKQTPLKPKGP